MKYWYHPYELKARSPLNSRVNGLVRQGALIRVEFGDGRLGYADCHPWPELGDPPLSEQLLGMREGNPTRLMARSLEFASLDAGARSRGISLFDKLEIPESHLLVTEVAQLSEALLEEAFQAGFTRVKLKLGRNIPSEAEHLKKLGGPAKLLFRLDFNSKLTSQEASELLDELGGLTERIDFVEDPFPFDEKLWGEFYGRFQVPMAIDRESEKWVGKPNAAQVWVIKPALQDPERFATAAAQAITPHPPRLVVTSYLDHPLGQLGAAYVAARFSLPEETHGLLSHRVYEANVFSEALSVRGCELLPPQGVGFGFDDQLAQLKWLRG